MIRERITPTVFALGLAATVATPAAGQVFSTPLPELPDDQEVLVVEVDMAPGHASQPHRHNAHVFVYVLEGTVQMQVEGGELMTLSPGEMFYETPGDVHTVSRNASDTEPARILVHLIRTAGTPVSVPVGR